MIDISSHDFHQVRRQFDAANAKPVFPDSRTGEDLPNLEFNFFTSYESEYRSDSYMLRRTHSYADGLNDFLSYLGLGRPTTGSAASVNIGENGRAVGLTANWYVGDTVKKVDISYINDAIEQRFRHLGRRATDEVIHTVRHSGLGLLAQEEMLKSQGRRTAVGVVDGER